MVLKLVLWFEWQLILGFGFFCADVDKGVGVGVVVGYVVIVAE